MPATDSTPAIETPGSNRDAIQISRGDDCALTAAAMTMMAATLGHAVDLKDGDYSPAALVWLTISVALCLIAVLSPRYEALERLLRRMLPLILVVAIVDQTCYLMKHVLADPQIATAFVTLAALGLLQAFPLRRLRWPLMLIMALAFSIAGCLTFNLHAKNAAIDVFMFQMNACWALVHRLNPYSFRYPCIYPPDTSFYGPGIVDSHGLLTVGFPYPPLSLFLTLPGYLIGQDVRYCDVAAMALSACLILAANPGRTSALAATLLLLMPRAVYVFDLSWTEPLLVLTFSMVMFCAFRWPRALPYALGLYLSTKQYAVLALPLLPLLIAGPNPWRTIGKILFKAALVIAVINLPFFAINPHAFVRSLVLFQLMQPFRLDALSYLVLLQHRLPQLPRPAWISLVPLVVIIPLSLRRFAGSPAGFAAAVTAVHLFFFAFNKQAFCNYYYFVIATACWAVAASRFTPVSLMHPPRTADNTVIGPCKPVGS